jgi:hypothetical protein
MSNLDTVMTVEGIAQGLPLTEGKEYRWKVHTTLKTAKTMKTNMPPAEFRAVSQLRKDPLIKN